MAKHEWKIAVGSGKLQRNFTIAVTVDEAAIQREFDKHEKAGDRSRIDETRVVRDRTKLEVKTTNGWRP